ncbi:hypothetical protein GL213_00095 [Halogeometricum borinquense]|uniref:Uncharacterized protein n=1 Tax=Halogeometricum borinquense TaxID=60847 RepID=A0A6C0UCD5_9EURY|nr:hypothetical protein [Halogeometricum borinquense]QIB72956.1 hypothetical protein G3I44_00850 [Halogeometricum borinquense]QIQ77660.1 hypothetical protein GL213_00095 [Halogeometricum borinquense]
MRRNATILMTAMLLVAALATVPMASVAQSEGGTTATETPMAGSDSTSNESTQSGELLSGVLAVQDAEIEREVETRTFGIRVAQAATDEAKADVVAERLNSNEARLAELEQRKARLEAARENGSISKGEYNTRMARVAAETETVKELTNRSATASERLPNELLEQRGVNTTAIRTLATRAEDLTGPEVSEIARQIAGSATTRGNATAHRGPFEEVPARGNHTENGNEQANAHGQRETLENTTNTKTASSTIPDNETTTDTPLSGSEQEASERDGDGSTNAGKTDSSSESGADARGSDSLSVSRSGLLVRIE